MNSKKVFLWKHVRENKYVSSIVEVELLQVNLEYIYIQKPDEKEDTVSLRDLAPLPDEPEPIKGNLQGESITRAE